MTTLCLDVALENACSRDLHDWIGGSWALLFSNPEDFDPQASEKTQWLEDLRQQFDTRAVRALAVKRDGQPESSWIEELQLDRQLIRLREPPFAAADAVSFAARALRGELLTLKSRFVLLVDGAHRRPGGGR
jgi:alkyl hydroperoxide reductase subunit AhpC